MKKSRYWLIPLCLVFKLGCGDSPQGKTVLLTKIDAAHEIKRWELSLKKAETNKDAVAYARARLQLNFITEKKAVEKNGGDLEKVHRKYELLADILNSEVRQYQSKRSYSLGSIVNSAIVLEPKDVVYKGPEFVSVYHPDTLREVNRVFKDFGDLYVKETRADQGSNKGKIEPRSVRAKERPWSGFWYPFNNDVLYAGNNSLFARLDTMMSQRGILSSIQKNEMDRYKAFNPETWEGLCDAWSIAAILHKEPTAKRIVDGMEFSIADQKAIMTFGHLLHPRKVYGISYKGNAETDGTYQDMKPEAYHRIITAVLGREQRSVIVDDVAGPQVWNKPQYSYRWTVEQDPDFDYIMNVRGFARLINQRSKETDELTTDADYIIPTYEYRLYVDKQDSTPSGYRVIAGQWMNDSFYDHPDTVTYVPPFEAQKLGSHNEEFNKVIPQLRRDFFANY